MGSNTEGNYNTAVGAGGTLADNTTGTGNTGLGALALHLNSTGQQNTATGREALYSNTVGQLNTATGAYSLHANSDGIQNTANGSSALNSNTTGSGNTAVGADALLNNTTGIDNIALGKFAGQDLTTGDRNIAIGHRGVAGDSNTVRIGNANHTRVFVQGIEGRTTGIADAVTVVIDSNGQLGTVSSSRRYKEDISDMGEASDRLLRLNPVTFHYRQARDNGEQPLEYGLIAEEVAQVFPELVVFNDEDQPETVKYRLLSSLLLNELQKQHVKLDEQYRVNQEQEARLTSLNGQVGEIAELQVQVAELNRRINQMPR